MGRTRTGAAAGITLDAGALIASHRGDQRMIALLDRALAQGRAFQVPSGVSGQDWRNGRVQVTLARFLRSEEVKMIPLDEQLARSCGELCAATNTSDIIDASVVILARVRRDPIVTSDPDELRRLDPLFLSKLQAGRFKHHGPRKMHLCGAQSTAAFSTRSKRYRIAPGPNRSPLASQKPAPRA